MNKNLLFASALSLCFLNQLAPMYDDPKYGLTNEQINELEKNDKKNANMHKELEELYSLINKSENDKENEEIKAAIDNFKNKDKHWKIFVLLYSETQIASDRYHELLQTNTIKNQGTRCDEISKLKNILTKQLNKYIEMAKKISLIGYKQNMIKFVTESLEKEKDIFEKMVTCLQDMKRKIDSIIKEIEG